VIVIEDGSGGAVGVEPTLLERLHARAGTARLDSYLAAGASPDATTLLALRSRRARNLLAAANRATGWSRGHPVPAARNSIRAASFEFSALAAQLVRPGVVAPQGVARAARLLSAAWGPQLLGSSAEQLREDLRDTIDSLDPLRSL
jgi:hypothetical protein